MRKKNADRDEDTLPRTRHPRSADPAVAPNLHPKITTEVLALQRAVGNEATAAILATNAATQRSAADDVLGSTGRPLETSVRTDMEARLGADFSTVRVHTGAAAEQSATALGARAYTSRENIVLGSGGGDRHTLAHELTHVIQQRSGPVAGTDNGAGLSVSDPSDAFERAAEDSARQALHGPASAPVEPHTDHGHQRGRPVQLVQDKGKEKAKDSEPEKDEPTHKVRALVKRNLPDLTDPQVKKIQRWAKNNGLEVPMSLPEGGATTRSQGRQAGRSRDTRLNSSGTRGKITWEELIFGKPITMAYGARDASVRPHAGPALGSAVNALLDIVNTPKIEGDKELKAFATVLMDWLVQGRSNNSGQLQVVTAPPKDGAGARVTIKGRPGWDNQANQIVTGEDENRRHIIAWHTMRQAFHNILNAALRDGDDVLDRMRRLVHVLEEITTEADPVAASPDETADEGGAAAGTAPAGTAEAAGLSEATPVTATPAPAQENEDDDAKELSKKLTDVVTKVMNQLSNNPYNLWAGHGITNKAINRVRWQLSARLESLDNDTELIKDVRERAEQAAETPNEDQTVWTEVRKTLKGTPPEEARTIIQSIIDSFDIDLPVSGDKGPVSSTYAKNKPDERAATKNVLANGDIAGLAQEVLAMADNPLPADFDTLIDTMESWLRRYLSPENLQTTRAVDDAGKPVGNRTVSVRPGSS